MEIFYLGLASFLASILGTIGGFGTSTALVPIVLFFLPYDETLLLVAIIHWFNGVWRLIFFHKGIDLKLVFAFGIPGTLLSICGASLIYVIPHLALEKILGVFLIIYSLMVFKDKLESNPISRKIFAPQISSAVTGGIFSGLVTGLIGAGGAIRTMFLLPFKQEKAAYIGTAGVIMLLVDSSRMITYVFNGTFVEENLYWALAIMILVSLIGTAFAKKIVKHIPQEKFKYLIAIFLSLVGLKLLIPL